MNEKELRAEASRLMDAGDYDGAGKLLSSLKHNKKVKKTNQLKYKYRNIISKSLTELLAKNDMTIGELSRKTGLAEMSIRNAQRGLTKEPSYRFVAVIADFFGVSTDYFRGK